jgi:hypothetical protein
MSGIVQHSKSQVTSHSTAYAQILDSYEGTILSHPGIVLSNGFKREITDRVIGPHSR